MKPTTTCALLGLLLMPLLARGAFEGFLEIPGISGGSADPAHTDWIELVSLTNAFGSVRSDSGRPLHPVLQDMVLVKRLDRASPLLKQACLTGNRISNARIDCIQPRGLRVRFYQIVLNNVIVKQVDTASTALEAAPQESLALSFDKISWTYTEFDSRTAVPARYANYFWDLTRNVGGASNTVVQPFRVSARPEGNGAMVLNWPGTAGTTYRILGSDQVGGPFLPFATVLASVSGPQTRTLTTSGGRRFFAVEEAPR